jgi:hypothetical protein
MSARTGGGDLEESEKRLIEQLHRGWIRDESERAEGGRRSRMTLREHALYFLRVPVNEARCPSTTCRRLVLVDPETARHYSGCT